MQANVQSGGLATVLLRNAFYSNAYTRVVWLLIFLSIINCGLVIAIIYKHFTPPAPQYVAMTPDGRIIQVHKLTDPSVADEKVLKFAEAGVKQAFDLNFVHWKQQLGSASKYFTASGFRGFMSALELSNQLNTLTRYKMISNVEFTAPPRIVARMVVGGHFAWKIQMPIRVSLVGSDRKTPGWIRNVSVIVLRMPVQYFPSQIAINNFLPEVVGKG